MLENVWLTSALWIGLALLSALISIRIALSVALVEIVVGAIGGNLSGMTPNEWVSYLAGVGAIVLTFLAGTEIDPAVIRRHVWSTMTIGAAGFLAPYLGVLTYAHVVLDWPWPQARSRASRFPPLRSRWSTRSWWRLASTEPRSARSSSPAAS